MIKVLVVDDSAFMRKAISEILESDPKIKVIDTARNGAHMFEKIEYIGKENIDVITLDINMPVMDGKEALEKLKQDGFEIPVVIISSLTTEEANITLELLDLGAFDFITKPSGTISLDIHKVSAEIIEKVKNAAKNKGRVRRLFTKKIHRKPIESITTPKRNLAEFVVAIGISTGGPATLIDILQDVDPIPENVAFLVVQHMPPQFTPSLAERLSQYSSIQFYHTAHGQSILGGYGYLAPGGWHMQITQAKKARLFKDDKYIYYPSVDVLFYSVAEVYKENSIGILLTGIGRDGAEGLLEMKKQGAYTIAESEETAVVYGMPRAAKEIGAAIKILPAYNIAREINLKLKRLKGGL